eukprot:5739259-Pyramimonas_sp.AAC.1
MPKCILVPLGLPFCAGVEAEMRARLAAHPPSWGAMTAADRGEYLGALMGPAVTISDIWKAAGSKRTI